MRSTQGGDTENHDLRARIEAFSPDEPGVAFPFTARLAKENGWTREEAAGVTREYLRFVYLAMTAGHPVTPSRAVDEAWHLHLTYTHSYWEEMCGRVLGRPLHHEPTRGGSDEEAKFTDWYARTLDSYRAAFGEEPPEHVWPRPRMAAAESARVVARPARAGTGPSRRHRPRVVLAGAAVVAIVVAVVSGPGWGLFAGVLALAGGFFAEAAASVSNAHAYPTKGERRRAASGAGGGDLAYASCGGGGCGSADAGCDSHSGCSGGGDGCDGGGSCGSSCGSSCGGGGE